MDDRPAMPEAASRWIRTILRYRSEHPAMLRALDVLGRLLDRPYRTSMLLWGEPGTGKEGMARAFHAASAGGRPFVAVAAGRRDPTTLAREIFGDASTEGAAGRAAGGTLYLDDVGTLDAELQARLVRLLRGAYETEAGAEPRRCDLRIIATADHDLQPAVAAGRFRHDLFYKLARIELWVPPLRERRADIPRTALWIGNRVLGRAGLAGTMALEEDGPEDDDVASVVLTIGAAELLAAHDWPGNFRELEAVLERALLLYGDPTRVTREDAEQALATPVVRSEDGG